MPPLPVFQGLSPGIVFKHFFSERSKAQMSLYTGSKIIAGNVFFSLGLNIKILRHWLLAVRIV